jgi:hypothetical protein
MSREKTFYVLIISGIVFVIIGTLSIYDSNIPRAASLDGTLKTNATDILTPIMNTGSKAKITIDGSRFDFAVYGPDKEIILSVKNMTYFNYDLDAKKSGEFRFEIKNIGTSSLNIMGSAETKASPLALGAAMMLIITGIIVAGLGIRSKIR